MKMLKRVVWWLMVVMVIASFKTNISCQSKKISSTHNEPSIASITLIASDTANRSGTSISSSRFTISPNGYKRKSTSRKKIFAKNWKSQNGTTFNLSGNIGENISIECPFSGEKITWLKNGKNLDRRFRDMPISYADDDRILKLDSLLEDDAAVYTCVAQSKKKSYIKNFNLIVTENLISKPIILRESENKSANIGDVVHLNCPVRSDFVFERLWSVISHNNITKIEPDGVSLNLTNYNETLSILITARETKCYICSVENRFGDTFIYFWIEIRPETEISREHIGKSSVLLIYVVLAIFILVTIMALFLVYKKIRHKKRYQDYDASLKMVDNKLYFTNVNHVSKIVDPLSESDILKKWEISKQRLTYISELGEGEFGVVMKAEMKEKNGDGHQLVAVKLAKPGSSNEMMLWEEAKTMMKLEGNTNVLSMLGCCIRKGPILIVMEFAPYGNLRDFLRLKKPKTVYHEYHNQHVAKLQSHFVNPYTNNEHTNQSNECLLKEVIELSKVEVNYRTLLSFGRQVAKGMEFLALKQCIHRDLAARNVLVGNFLVLKIADFGLSRNICNQDYYKKTSKGRLPVKWMAPEVLFENICTLKSDIWSYGVLLWEIFTFGDSPYPGIPYKDFCNLLKEGYQMCKPQCASEEVYSIMKQCWTYDADARPSFSHIVPLFDRIISHLFSRNYLDLYVDVKEATEHDALQM